MGLEVLFVIRDLRVLILVSCYHVYLADLVLNRLKACSNASGIVYDIVWFSGVYELGWLLNVGAVRYCACVVLGFVLKGISEHSNHVITSVYNTILKYPVINAVYALSRVEQAWLKAFSLDAKALVVSLNSVLGASAIVNVGRT
ncbi:6,7-dimethyl-8-ribityllumazine synthase [Candidatus Hodgkinia cicadicola]|nr:6,7-dimethyl-8-ribityllumazine synthase [Candidatus Hodgkinia cicadicola]